MAQLIRMPRCLLPSVDLSHRHRLPKAPGVYYIIQPWRQLFGKKSILYIGKSKNIRARWADHHKFGAFYGMWGLRLHYITMPDREIHNFEAEEIKRYDPPCNDRYEKVVPSFWWQWRSLQKDLRDIAIMVACGAPFMFAFILWIHSR
jgi:excinuclease UvrABC nuclease subunit